MAVNKLATSHAAILKEMYHTKKFKRADKNREPILLVLDKQMQQKHLQ